MKTKIFLVLLFILISFNVKGQSQFAYYKNSKALYSSSIKGETKLLGQEVKIIRSKILTPSNYYTYSFMPKEILVSMPISEGMVFYSALQSLQDNNIWLFVERNMEKFAYNLCLFDSEKKTKKIIFSQNNSPDVNFAFKPFAWSKSKDIVYLEALIFGSAIENDGIWSYNIVTKQISKLSVSPSYLITPIISPDGEYFIYEGTSDTNKDLDSPSNILFVYNIITNQEKTVVKDNNARFSIYGWIDDNIETSDLININEEESYLKKKISIKSATQSPSFMLPWSNGISYCVSTGAIGVPPGSIGSSIICGTFTTDHTNNSIDFDIPNGVYDAVRASAAGTIIFAGINGSLTSGYGRLVKIKHSDNTITYYAHLNTISVNVNDIVQQGCVIGDGGNTGNSTGDHIHFEWYDVGDVRFSTTNYPTFGECGCTPRRNYQYTSNNIDGSCGENPPPNDNCSLGTPITSNGASQNGTVAGATGSYGANQCSGCSCTSPDDKDVYYYFTAQASSHTITVSNLAIDFDAVIELRAACSSGSAISCWDPTGKPSSVSHTWDNLINGQTYYIRVFEFNYSGTPPSSPTFNISVTHSTSSLPDLRITSGTQTVNPTTVNAGSNITASCSEDNIGDASAGANHVTLWLSSNSTLDEGTDIKLGQISFASLAKQTCSVVQNTTVQIPTNTSSESYYLFFWADGNKVVTESDDNNNFVSTQIIVAGSSCTTPTVQTSAITFSSVGTNSMTANWTNGNGSRRVIKINTSNSFTAPGNGIDPSPNTSYSGSGEQVVYNGTSNNVTVSGLSANTTYWFRVYEANCTGSSSLYYTVASTNNPNSQSTISSCTTPSNQANSITFSGVGTNSMTTNWTNGNGSRRVVKINTSNSFIAPGNGTDPSANTTYSGSGEQVVYNGTSNSVTVTGLSASTTYWFRVYEAHCTGSSSLYYTVTASNNPNSQTTTSSCTVPIASVNSPSGSSPLTMTCTSSGGSGGTIAYKWYSGTTCSGTVLGTSSTLSVSTSGYYSCMAYINGFETTCNSYGYGYASLNSSQEKTICSWSYKSNMPVGRYSSASATYGNHIYIIGGNSSKSFYQYDVINDNFITKTQIPVGGTDESQGAVLGNKIYLCHGFSDENVRIYDISTDTWAIKSKRPIGSYGRGAVFKAVNNYLYAIGGGDDNLNPSSQLDKYDPVNDAWSTINNPMPTSRCFASAVVHNNMIYVIGGRTTSGVSNVVEVYDPKSNTWSTKSPMPLKRNSAVAEVINNKIYVIGGFTGSTYSNSIQEYNITTDSWNTVNLAPSFINVVDAVSGVVNDKIYVIGGSNSSGTVASTEELTLCAVESCTTPGTPVSVTGTSTGQTTANMSWSVGNPVGSATVTYYWVVGTSSSVTYGNGVAQSNTSGTSVSISALSPGTSYYLRVYAKTSCNETSSGYNTSTSFTTASVAILPTLTTTAPIATSVTTAVSGGNIASDGGSPITAKGVCWGLSINPTILNSKSIDGSGNGSFSSNISGLTPNTTYHVRAYATNSQGTGYGSDIQFTTIPSAPIIGSINQPTCTQSYGSVVLNGLPSNGTWTIIQAPGGTTITGTGSNTTISGLDPGNYTFQVTNAAGSTSGSSANIMIAAQVMMPTVVTSSVFDATQSTVSSGGNVTSDGGATVTARGLCWSTTSNPTILNSKTSDGLSIGTFTSTITGLTNGVIYHIRAYATNCKGTAYGLDIQYMHNSTSILEIQNDEVSVFPNPVSGMLNIVYKSDNFETIKILNSQGKLISKGKVIKPSQQLDFSIYDSGLYILEFIKKTNEVKRIKVIKH